MYVRSRYLGNGAGTCVAHKWSQKVFATLVRIRGEDMLRHNVLIVTHGEGDIRSDTIDQQ